MDTDGSGEQNSADECYEQMLKMCCSTLGKPDVVSGYG